ncbi:replicative DNA helicase [Desulfitibacter alkalitolerans]|uniref:replicative DNA helicase n=1 Tax=Desulfitibacter alkalitolerans TaxID=264641 RepID=UPI000486FA00|nr:replicative DNA helicase [Desulfitibacter alkalitolerans]
MSVVEERLPPHSIEAEQAVLGALMIDPETIYSVVDILKPEDFYRQAHRVIYQVILELIEKNKPVDMLTVVEALRQNNKIEEIGGATYIAALSSSAPTSANISVYAGIIIEKGILRSLISAASQIVHKSYHGNLDTAELLDEAEKIIFEIGQKKHKEGFSHIKDILVETFDQVEKLTQHKGDVTGIPTFKDLDKLLSGLQASDLIICAARPAMGKTSFCMNIAQKVACGSNTTVAIFSLEMSKEQLVQRLWASEAMVDQHKLRSGNLNEEDWKRLIRAAEGISDAPIFIDDTPSISVMEVRAKARRLKSEAGLGLIIVDYLQLMRGSRRVENRQQEISEISRSLKGLARELDVPVLALSQLSRAVEQTHDKRPNLSHLRESGALEQDSDVVMFIHRPDYFDPESEKKGIAEIILAKHRHGPTGTVELVFLPEFTKFVDYAKGSPEA